MGVTVKETEVRLTSDATRLKKGYNDAAAATDKLTKTINKQVGDLKKKIAQTFTAVLITKFFKDAGQVAIDAEETFSKFGTVFEDVVGDAALAAQDLTENYGLSEIAAKKLLASTGDLLTGLGAQDDKALALSSTVQKLSVDISSFQNLQGGATQASEIITKAMLGERDALTTLGVKILESDVQHELMRRGQEKLTGQALLLAKAQITLSGIMSQSGKAIGDYARTSDSAANQIRRLSNTFEDFQLKIGSALTSNESFTAAMQTLTDILTDQSIIDAIATIGQALLGGFQAALPILKTVIEVLAGVIKILTELKDVIVPLGVGLATAFIASKVLAFAASFTILGGSVTFSNIQLAAHIGLSKAAAAASALLGKAMPLIALAAAAATLVTINKLLKDLASQTDKVIASEMRHSDMMQVVTEKFRDFRDFAKINSKQLQEMSKDFAHVEDRGMRFNLTMRAIRDGKYGPELAKQYGEWRKSGRELSKTLADLTTNNDELEEEALAAAEAIKAQKKAAEAARKAYEKLADTMGILTDKGIVKQSEEIKSLLKLYGDNKDQILGNKGVTEKWIDSIDGLAKKALPEEKKALENILIPLKMAVEEEEDFSDIANALNTDVLPKATIEFQKLEDKIEDSGETTEETANKFAELADSIAGVGIFAAGLLSQLGILGDEGADIAGDLFNSFAGGAAAFAQFSSGDILGGIQSAIGAIGSLASAFSSFFGGESGEMEAAKRNINGITGLTEDWSTKIEELAKEIGGAGSAEKAFATLLPGIIADSDNTVSSFHELVNSTREMVSTLEWAGDAGWDMQESFGAAFDELIKKSKEMGLEGGTDMTGLIMLADEMGIKVKAIAEYVETKDIAAFDAWKNAVEAFGGASIPIFDEMMRKEEIMALIPDDIKSGIEGLTGALVNLSDAHRLTGEEFDVFEDKTLAALEALEASGVKGFDAIEPMQELLDRLAFLQDEYGFAVDDSIQALIDEGKASGEITGSISSDSEKQIALQERMVDALERLSDGFFGVTKSIDGMGQAGERMAGRMNDDLSKTQRNLSGIADTINTDVVDALSNMGNTSDDVMRGNSIIPDYRDWQKEIEHVKEKIANDLIASMLDMGKTYDEIQKEINENPLLQELNLDSIRDEFESLFDDITDGAEIGSKALFEMMEAGENLGFGVEIEAFKKENLDKALESFTDIKDIGKIDLREIRKEIRETEKELVGMKAGSFAFDKIQDKLDGLKQKLSDTTAAQRVFGDLSIGVLDDMFRLQEKVGKNETLVNGIKSAISLLGDFSKAENLSKSEFQDFEDIATKSFNELLTAGFTRKQAFNTISPLLEQLDFLDKEFDLSIDGITRGLIEEGRKLGEVGEIQKTEQEKMIDQMGITNQLLSQLVEGLGIKVPDAIRDSISDLTDMQINTNANMAGVPELLTPSIRDIPVVTGGGFNLTDPGAPSFDMPGDATSPVSKTVTIDMKITAADVNPVVLAEKIKFIITDNTQGVTDVIARI